MEAIFWDGVKQLKGELQLLDDRLIFKFSDFIQSSINLELMYKQLATIEIKKIYEISIGGVELIMKNGQRNTFVVSDPLYLKNLVEIKCEGIT